MVVLIICLFISGCAGSSLLRGLVSSCCKWGLLSSCRLWASHCGGFSRWGAPALEHKLSRCGTWDLLHPGIELGSPASQVDSLLFEPPGSPGLPLWTQ